MTNLPHEIEARLFQLATRDCLDTEADIEDGHYSITEIESAFKRGFRAAWAMRESEIANYKACEFAWKQQRRETERIEKWLAKGRYSIEQEAAKLEAERDRLRAALELVVRQFEDMNDSSDIREHWHKIAREALNHKGAGE